MTLTLGIHRLPHAEGLDLPSYATAGAAGLDVRAAIEGALVLAPGDRALVPTGLVLLLPAGHEGQVRPRSGLAVKYGLTVLNAPGTIDEDYRGELMVPLINLGDASFTIEHGMRIAQLVVAPVTHVEIEALTERPGETERGTGGFGSTGVN